MAPLSPISHRSLEQLEDDIVCLSQRVNAAEYEFLVLVSEFDLRQGWKAWHFNHCAEWLNYKCGIQLNTAREKVRVANGLWDLPLLSAAFQGGELSYSKARALTRVATPITEAGLLEYAMAATAEQVENHCRAIRNGMRRESTKDANRVHKNRYLSRCKHGDGSMTISVELPEESGELVLLALEKAIAARRGEDSSGVDTVDASAEASEKSSKSAEYFARQADALVEIAQAYLCGGTQDGADDGSSVKGNSADHYQVVVHVDERVLAASASTADSESIPNSGTKRDASAEARSSGGGLAFAQTSPRHCDLPIETVRRLCCDTSLVAVTEDENGDPLNTSRKHRTAPPALRRALIARDKCCRYPGCSHDKWLEVHHVEHWIDGGETCKENTLLLCSKHHRLLHEGGYSIKTNYAGELYFETASGRVVPDAPMYRPSLEADRAHEAFEVKEPAVLYDATNASPISGPGDWRMPVFPAAPAEAVHPY